VLKALTCEVCGKEIKGYTSKEHPFKYCSRECYYSGRLAKNIEGAFAFETRGYIFVYSSGYPIREHVYIIEKQLGRKLHKNEVVHHKNENRSDNRLENLQLMTRAEHSGLHHKEIAKRQARDNKGNFIRKGEINGAI
jgi:hypothetical protein